MRITVQISKETLRDLLDLLYDNYWDTEYKSFYHRLKKIAEKMGI